MRIPVLLVASMLVFSPPGWAAEGDVVRGERIYERCGACHSLERNRTGPKHCGLFGRRAGSLPGYAYSRAMIKSGITWDVGTLDRFLVDPLKAMPGTKMGYAGVKDPTDRSDLIAYLKHASRDPALCE